MYSKHKEVLVEVEIKGLEVAHGSSRTQVTLLNGLEEVSDELLTRGGGVPKWSVSR